MGGTHGHQAKQESKNQATQVEERVFKGSLTWLGFVPPHVLWVLVFWVVV